MPPTLPEVTEKLKHAPNVAGVEDLILRRWSPRAFSDKEVSAAELKTLFEAARWAASSSNEQPWRFLVGRRGDATYQKIFNALVEFNQTWAGRAPVLVLSVAKKTFTEKGHPNAHSLHDTGASHGKSGLAGDRQRLAHSFDGRVRSRAHAGVVCHSL